MKKPVTIYLKNDAQETSIEVANLGPVSKTQLFDFIQGEIAANNLSKATKFYIIDEKGLKKTTSYKFTSKKDLASDQLNVVPSQGKFLAVDEAMLDKLTLNVVRYKKVIKNDKLNKILSNGITVLKITLVLAAGLTVGKMAYNVVEEQALRTSFTNYMVGQNNLVLDNKLREMNHEPKLNRFGEPFEPTVEEQGAFNEVFKENLKEKPPIAGLAEAKLAIDKALAEGRDPDIKDIKVFMADVKLQFQTYLESETEYHNIKGEGFGK